MFTTNKEKFPNGVIVAVGTMGGVAAESGNKQGDMTTCWKPSMELFCKNKRVWLRMEGTDKRREMDGFYSDEEVPSGS